MAICSIAVAAGIVGFLAVVKRLVFRRRFGLAFAGGPCAARGYGGGHDDEGGGWGRRWGSFRGGRGGIGGSFWLRALFRRLDTTPGQEREIRAALEEMRDRARDAKEGIPETRENIGKAIRGDEFDASALEVVSARLDATSEKMKDAFSSALKRIHGVLDPKQRERLAEIIGRGLHRGGQGFGGGGPYRGAASL